MASSISVETTSVSIVVDTEAASHLACIIYQYAKLTSPSKGETTVSGSPTFFGEVITGCRK